MAICMAVFLLNEKRIRRIKFHQRMGVRAFDWKPIRTIRESACPIGLAGKGSILEDWAHGFAF